MLIVTGSAGFIGGALARALVADGRQVLSCDAVGPEGRLDGVDLVDHLDPEALLARVTRPAGLEGVTAVLHQGACSSTTVDDEELLRRVNDGYSTRLLAACRSAGVPLVYASSAAVYGDSPVVVEDPANERPLNAYARSKARFDAVVREELSTPGSPVVGLRYFNVYGPGEAHKGPMASMVLQLHEQIRATGVARLFGAGEGCGPGEHSRDFVAVEDVVAVVRHLAAAGVSGIFNCGTGTSRSFLDLARAVIAATGTGEVAFVPFPDALRGRYQARTRAELTRLRATGAPVPSTSLEDGVARYVAHLRATSSP